MAHFVFAIYYISIGLLDIDVQLVVIDKRPVSVAAATVILHPC